MSLLCQTTLNECFFMLVSFFCVVFPAYLHWLDAPSFNSATGIVDSDSQLYSLYYINFDLIKKTTNKISTHNISIVCAHILLDLFRIFISLLGILSIRIPLHELFIIYSKRIHSTTAPTTKKNIKHGIKTNNKSFRIGNSI